MDTTDFTIPIYETRIHQVGDDKASSRPQMTSQDVATEFCKKFLKEKNRENMIVLLLDMENHVIGMETVAVGTNNRSSIWVSAIVLPALLKGAPRIIMCHNHPLGEAYKITANDVELTKLVQYTCSVLGIELLDHIVVDDKENSFSIMEYLMNKDAMDQFFLSVDHVVE